MTRWIRPGTGCCVLSALFAIALAGCGSSSTGPAPTTPDASALSIVRTSAIFPSPNRIRKTADNRSYVNYTHLHVQPISLAPRPVEKTHGSKVAARAQGRSAAKARA